MSEPISFSDKLFLVWCEPDEGSYNYQLFPLRSRWNGTAPVNVPNHIVERIRNKASKTYPIMVVDGYSIDNKIDIFARINDEAKWAVRESFGMHPRRVTGTMADNWGDSVNAFLAFVESGEKI
jgi:hypothetical protein